MNSFFFLRHDKSLACLELTMKYRHRRIISDTHHYSWKLTQRDRPLRSRLRPNKLVCLVLLLRKRIRDLFSFFLEIKIPKNRFAKKWASLSRPELWGGFCWLGKFRAGCSLVKERIFGHIWQFSFCVTNENWFCRSSFF